jgi:hypothetical protein
MKLFAICLFLCLSSAFAFGQKTILTGNQLQEQCVYWERQQAGNVHTEEERIKAMFCVAFIRGVVDTINLDQLFKVTRLDEKGQKIAQPCIPDSVPNSQANKVVMKYLNDNPALLNYAASELITEALKGAFPCH